MPRRTRLTFEGDQYLLCEEPHGLHHPVLTLFTHERNQKVAVREGGPSHQTESDRWSPIATWVDGHVVPVSPYEDLDPSYSEHLFHKYLEVREQAERTESQTYFYLSHDDVPVHLLIDAQPGGLVVPVYRDEEKARAARDQLEAPAAIESTGSLRRFLAARAEEGFAGAVLDDLVYVFWCLDAEQKIQFLALHARAEEDEVRGALLVGENDWKPWDGEGELEFLDDQDSWDGFMERTLGELPFFGYRDGIVFLALYAGDELLVVEPDEDEAQDGEIAHAPIFFEREAAEQYRREQGYAEHQLRTIGDLASTIRAATERGAVTRLQPGEHRARSASLWCDGADVVLDGFCGFWRSADGHSFRRIR